MMVVDDNPANLKLASDVLEIEGYDICRCIDAEDAIKRIPDFQPALILMDVALPGMDGIQLTRKLKSERSTADIVIVALTAFAMKDDRERLMSSGFDGYITKPINTRSFGKEVESHLKV